MYILVGRNSLQFKSKKLFDVTIDLRFEKRESKIEKRLQLLAPSTDLSQINYRITFLDIASDEFGWFAAKWSLVTFGKFTKNASFEVNGVAPNIIIACSISYLSNELMST